MSEYSSEKAREIARREEGRPDPEELLRRYGLQDPARSPVPPAPPPAPEIPREQIQGKRENSQVRRGRLRVYLAAASGAGKTYAMLNEGHRRKDRGTDVVVGYIETHGWTLTQEQIKDLEIIARKSVAYRGAALEEMDTEAIIARHPRVVLIDDLAHTNVPGSRHPKRYQDVFEILDAGIKVVTTLNIQHMESLNDLVASITGVRVAETLPDWVLDQAEEVELIDISPYALRQRIRQGHVCPPEGIAIALTTFFREDNLTALRELALRRTAEKTESQLEQYMTEHGITERWSTGERVLVGFDARPHTREVIRDACRLAHSLHAELLAVFIEQEGYLAFTSQLIAWLTCGSKAKQHHEDVRRRLEEHARLAEDLGAEVIRTKGRDVARTLVEVARQRNATQLVLGQPARNRWEELLSGSIINRLLRLSTAIDIHLVPSSRGLEGKRKAEQ